MRASDRNAVRKQFTFRCAYCGVSETDVGSELTIDHFRPVVHGGSEARSNLVYACVACNRNKGDTWTPESNKRILHPTNDDMKLHVTPHEDGTLIGLTETGSFHIERLKLNRPQLISLRIRRKLQSVLFSDVADVKAENRELRTEMEILRQAVLDIQDVLRSL